MTKGKAAGHPNNGKQRKRAKSHAFVGDRFYSGKENEGVALRSIDFTNEAADILPNEDSTGISWHLFRPTTTIGITFNEQMFD